MGLQTIHTTMQRMLYNFLVSVAVRFHAVANTECQSVRAIEAHNNHNMSENNTTTPGEPRASKFFATRS